VGFHDESYEQKTSKRAHLRTITLAGFNCQDKINLPQKSTQFETLHSHEATNDINRHANRHKSDITTTGFFPFLADKKTNR
jgi:hypothetical protein